MDKTRIVRVLALLICTAVSAAVVNSQSNNLLQNPNADEGGNGWRMFFLDASVEHGANGNPHFALRNGFYIKQVVTLPKGSAGKYALAIARTSSDWMNVYANREGFPFLSAETMSLAEDGHYIVTSGFGNNVWLPPDTLRANEWVTLLGRFQIIGGTVAIDYDVGYNGEWKRNSIGGPAVRFDDLGLYLFDTIEESDRFVKMYNDGLR